MADVSVATFPKKKFSKIASKLQIQQILPFLQGDYKWQGWILQNLHTSEHAAFYKYKLFFQAKMVHATSSGVTLT